MLYWLFLSILIIPLTILLPTKVIGRKNIPRKGKLIFCCNHQSNFDVAVIAIKILRRRFKYMTKDSLFKNKLFGGIIKRCGAYPVKRGQPDIVAIKKTFKLLNEENAICMFPEGTRVAEADKLELKNGAVTFALKTKAPIIPAIILKKPKIFRYNKFIIGKPINLSELEEFKDKKIDSELIEKAKSVLIEKMNELKEIK